MPLSNAERQKRFAARKKAEEEAERAKEEAERQEQERKLEDQRSRWKKNSKKYYHNKKKKSARMSSGNQNENPNTPGREMSREEAYYELLDSRRVRLANEMEEETRSADRREKISNKSEVNEDAMFAHLANLKPGDKVR